MPEMFPGHPGLPVCYKKVGAEPPAPSATPFQRRGPPPFYIALKPYHGLFSEGDEPFFIALAQCLKIPGLKIKVVEPQVYKLRYPESCCIQDLKHCLVP